MVVKFVIDFSPFARRLVRPDRPASQRIRVPEPYPIPGGVGQLQSPPARGVRSREAVREVAARLAGEHCPGSSPQNGRPPWHNRLRANRPFVAPRGAARQAGRSLAPGQGRRNRSEENTSELQSLMRSSYAVFCLKKKNHTN